MKKKTLEVLNGIIKDKGSCQCTWCEHCPFLARKTIRWSVKNLPYTRRSAGNLCQMELLVGALSPEYGISSSNLLGFTRVNYAKYALKHGIKPAQLCSELKPFHIRKLLLKKGK